MKRKILFLISIVCVLLMSTSAFAGWIQEGEFWKYEENGIFKTNEFALIDNNIYYFDANSHMVTGLRKIGDSYHAFHDNGIAYKKSDTFTFEGRDYEIGGRGKVKNIENHIAEDSYVINVESKAAAATHVGWVQEGEFWKYEENGAFKTNEFAMINNIVYYFDANSHMVTGLQKIGNSYYAFNDDGSAYKKNNSFTFLGNEYEIGAKGKVLELEENITEEDYKTYLVEKAAEDAKKAIDDANNRAFAEHQRILNESMDAIRKEQESLRAIEQAALAEQQAIAASIQAAAEEPIRARRQYLLSDENNKLITDAAKISIDAVISEMKRQLNLRKTEFVQKAKELKATNPQDNLSSIFTDFNEMIKLYLEKSDIILGEKEDRLSESAIEKYEEQFAEMFEEIEESFYTLIETSVK